MRTLAAFVLGLALLTAGCDSGPDRHAGSIQDGPSPTLTALEAMDPGARAIAERVVEFAGGAEAIDSVRTLEVRFEGTSNGEPIVFHLSWSRSGSAKYDMVLGPTTGRSGLQGERYWRRWEGRPAEVFVVDPGAAYGSNQDVDQVLDFATFPLTVINPTFSHIEGRPPFVSRGQGEFKGARTAVLSPEGEPRPGEPPMAQYHYDPRTGRPVGVVQGPQSEPLNIALSDWREVDGGQGLKMFHTATVDGFWLGGEVLELRATTVRVNTLDEADFAPPADAVLRK